MKIIDTQPTPNPNAMKILLDAPVADGTKSYFNAAMAKDDPLATRLFAIEGVSGVMLLGTMVTITKQRDADWAPVLAGVRKVLEAA